MTDIPLYTKRFILWDSNHKDPPRNDAGEFMTSGCMGVMGRDNVYLRVYPRAGVKLQDELDALEVGQCVRGVRYNLSGSSGNYDIYRVE